MGDGWWKTRYSRTISASFYFYYSSGEKGKGNTRLSLWSGRGPRRRCGQIQNAKAKPPLDVWDGDLGPTGWLFEQRPCSLFNFPLPGGALGVRVVASLELQGSWYKHSHACCQLRAFLLEGIPGIVRPEKERATRWHDSVRGETARFVASWPASRAGWLACWRCIFV
ncbi:hypothetical protein LY76DRAFT_410595 [Colletotrichum caudatum]|nr:hypothetical protein LY76DRAFT_410595 [Colletotrichum caudatum]